MQGLLDNLKIAGRNKLMNAGGAGIGVNAVMISHRCGDRRDYAPLYSNLFDHLCEFNRSDTGECGL